MLETDALTLGGDGSTRRGHRGRALHAESGIVLPSPWWRIASEKGPGRDARGHGDPGRSFRICAECARAVASTVGAIAEPDAAPHGPAAPKKLKASRITVTSSPRRAAR